MAHILLVEDEANARRVLALGLQGKGHTVTPCDGAEAAGVLMAKQTFDIVLTDLRMHGRDAGLEVVRAASRLQPQARAILVTAYASADTAVAAMREGAFDYLTKPVSGEELAAAVERALADREAVARAVGGQADDEGLIGSSVAMQRVRERLLRAAERDFTVLITGESGTGKELAARYVHRHSGRSAGPFIPVHCAAIPHELFESELFGCRRGAFTGAESDRMGLIEAADGGILFLDEVGEMPQAIQVKLLRVLQDHRVRRVGEDAERQVDVRVIAATNRDLASEVRAGRFREDLFYRLNVIPVHMPPLRQRREDIPELVEHLLARSGGEGVRLTPACMQALARLPLPGNVRELENLLQRMLALSDSALLDVDLLADLADASGQEVDVETLAEGGMNLDGWLAAVERRLIEQAIARSKGNITQAAKLLGVSFRSLRYRLRKLGINKGH